MEMQSASIGDVDGEGMAKVGTNARGLNICTGVLITESEADAMGLMDSTGVLYTGVLYDGSKKSNLSFPIIVSRIQGNRVEFSATGNPYEGRS